ncbi:M15 family metallopeptidase [Scytonema sp. NUACC26]|uniref:M15 family metallopeptidase n=1 Tax=Scytonema sp. NUACC26 TaxID=3140176 RepID=UPI0034DB905F
MSDRWLKFLVLMTYTLYFSVACHPIKSLQTTKPSVPPASPPMQRSLTPQKTSQNLKDDQLVDIQVINKNILLDIRYATSNNFLKKKLYPSARCVLRAAVAKRLSQVQASLQEQKLNLKVYDCYRPLSIQKQMWKVLPDERYVANPTKGSRHNRGAAVDLRLVDATGKELQMPSAFDDFTVAAHRNYSGGSAQARNNRTLLENAMAKHGFIGLTTEWWHFDALGWEKFPAIDVPFNLIPPITLI